MADCEDKRTGRQRFLDYLPIATVIMLLTLSVGFGVAWGQIREQVSSNTQTAIEYKIEKIEISKQLSVMSTNIEWLVKNAEKENKE